MLNPPLSFSSILCFCVADPRISFSRRRRMRHSDGKVFRNDALAKVTGRAKYTDDLKVSGMLHAVPVYGRRVRARIVRIHCDEARAVPGVVRVITYADVPGSLKFGQIERDYPMLVRDLILSEGDVVALVVGESRESAKAGAACVSIDAEDLEPLLDYEKALDPDSPVILPGKTTNLVNHGMVRRGNAHEAMLKSSFTVSGTFRTQRIEHAYMEPEAALAIPRPDGTMAVHGSMQHPYSTRRFVAAFLGESLSDIEVFNTTMGGGFGGKDDTAAIVCARAALAARLTGRPVKIRYDREWSFIESYKRHPYTLEYTFGFDAEGHLRAAEIDMLADSGPYLSVTPWVNWRSTAQCCGPYQVPAVRMDIKAVATNLVFTGAMRGFGAPQVNFAVEQLMDMAAQKAGLDPVEIRRRNMVRQGSTTITGQILDTHVVSLEMVMDTVLKASGFHAKYARRSAGQAENGKYYGIGMATSYRGASLGAEGMDYCSAIISVQQDGSVLLEGGIHENGQGAESTLILILAGQLGLPVSRIRYRMASTTNIPDGGTTVATRGTIMGGGAIIDAVRTLKNTISWALREELGCDAEKVTYENGYIISPSGIRIAWENAMRLLHAKCVYPYAFGSFKAPHVSWEESTGQGDAYFTYVYSCQVVELEVDKLTGTVRLLSMTAGHDVGKAINPELVRGQMFGGMAQAAGQALYENIEFENGRIRNPNFGKYRIPKAKDMPEMQGIILENADPNSPTGAKGIGEPSIELMAGAIANAVFAATGIRPYSLPVRLDPKELP